MSEAAKNRTNVPASVQEIVDPLCQCLRDALGDVLSSLILYGDVVRSGQCDPRHLVLNIMVVVNRVDVDMLESIAACFSTAVGSSVRVAPMVVTPQDLRSSTDVFPIKFQDIKEHHVLLAGEDLLRDLPVARDHLRLRCEQEIKNLMLRLRQQYIQRASLPETMEIALISAVTPLMNNLKVLYELKTGEGFSGEAADRKLLESLDKLGLDQNAMTSLLALKRCELKPDQAELKQLYNQTLQFVWKAAELVDHL